MVLFGAEELSYKGSGMAPEAGKCRRYEYQLTARQLLKKVDRGEQNVMGMLGRSAGLVAGRRTVNAESRCNLARFMNNLQKKSLCPIPV